MSLPQGEARVMNGCALAVLAASALAGLTLVGSVLAEEPSDPYAGGRAVYTKWCAPCHDPGVIHPGTNALTVKYRGRICRPTPSAIWFGMGFQ
jgi:mono/diheme cytochrome c family protein